MDSIRKYSVSAASITLVQAQTSSSSLPMPVPSFIHPSRMNQMDHGREDMFNEFMAFLSSRRPLEEHSIPSRNRVPAGLPSFKGGNDKITDFVLDMENILEADGFPLDRYGRVFVAQIKQRAGSEWLKRVIQVSNPAWPELRAMLLSHFGEASAVTRLQGELRSLRCFPPMSKREFCDQFMDLMIRSQLSPTTEGAHRLMIDLFKEGLSDPLILRELCSFESNFELFTSIDQVISQTLVIDDNLTRLRNMRAMQRPPTVPFTPPRSQPATRAGLRCNACTQRSGFAITSHSDATCFIQHPELLRERRTMSGGLQANSTPNGGRVASSHQLPQANAPRPPQANGFRPNQASPFTPRPAIAAAATEADELTELILGDFEYSDTINAHESE